MQKREIQITISPEGKVTYETKGFPGSSCIAGARFLEAALGGAVEAQEMTPEYYAEQGALTETKVG